MRDDATAKIRRCESALAEVYGRPVWGGPSNPVEMLVETLLSHNVNDVNRDRAYQRLRERFPDWDDVADAALEEVAEAVRPAGFPAIKGARIQTALRTIREQFGSISLDALLGWTDEQAKEYLRSFPGVGPKTAACVLCFAMGRPVMPVDTHVGRITRRLGLVPERATAEEAHDIMDSITPPELVFPFHVEMIRHGRALCRPTKPACDRCPITAECEFYVEKERGHIDAE